MRTLKILSILSIAGIIVLAFFSWYSCDDFCNKIELARYSVFKMAWLQYMNWDGRSIAMASLIQLFSLKYFPVEVTVFLWAASFVGTVIMIFKIIQLENPAFFPKNNSVVGIALLCATMWLGMWKLIPDIIYWPTGGSYSLLNLLGMVWLYVFLSGIRAGNFHPKKNIFIFFLSLICGVNSHNFVTALILLCLLELVQHRWMRDNKQVGRYCLFALIGLSIGAAVVFFAPGNKVRLQLISYHGYSSKFLYFYFIVLAKYIYWLLSLIGLCLFVAWMSGADFFSARKKISSASNEFFSGFRNKKSTFAVLYGHKYFLAALSTIAMFSATSYFAVPRTGIFFGTFIVIYFFQKIWKGPWKINSKRFSAGSSLFLGIFVCVIFFQLVKANSMKTKLEAREKLFGQLKGMDAAVHAISANSVPFAFAFTDISSDSGYWVNRCVAQHFELKTVRTVPE